MRVAFVAPLVTAIREPQLGGSQALLADIAQGLAGRGHEVTVFAADGSSIDGVEVVEAGVDPSALAATLFRADGSPAADDGAARAAFGALYERLRSDAFDVVHNHAFDAPAIELAPSALPVVHTLHLPPREDIADAITRARADRRVVIAAVSRFGAASWQQVVNVDVVLPNGVPVDRIPFSAEGSGLLFAGRLTPEKGVVEAIKIAAGAGRPITVVGDAYDERYATERIEPLRSEQVDIRSGVPRQELWRSMGRAEAVLCPALWDEPFGLVAAESQAAGTPVIAFARGALGEVIRDGETGALVTDVASAIDALDASYDRGACRAHAERSLSLVRTLDAHEALYERLSRVRAS